MSDFFISYNEADRDWAEWIAWHLEAEGHESVLQAWDFRPGANFVLEMQRAAETSTRTIAVLSPDYLASQFTQPEWTAAFAKDPTGDKGILIPIRVRECEPKGLLPQIVFVDLFGLTESAAQLELTRGIGRSRTKPLTEPSFPGRPSDSVNKPRYPGSLPRIWNIPHNRNLNFTGREDVLRKLSALSNDNQASPPIQVVHGLGGVGKTQIAVEYAYRNMNEYEVVWWMRAEENSTLAADFAHLAVELNLPEKDAQDQRVIVDAVRKWLGHNGDWLIVFDNAQSADDLRDYVPQGGSGRALVTSRNPNWTGAASSFSLDVLTKDEAIAFILKRTGQVSDADMLAEVLGYLPLALEQAGAYIEETGKSIAQYLQLFKKYQIELLGRGNVSTLYPATVRTTWQVSFQAAMAECPIVHGVLGLIGFLAPDKIPRSLLASIVEISTSPEDRSSLELHIDAAVASLRRYSLVDVVNNEVSIHRLVLAICRDTFKSLAQNLAAGVVGIINSVFPIESEDPRRWSETSALLPHALAAIRYAEDLNQVTYKASELLNKIQFYFIGRGENRDAKVQLEHALRIVISIYGEDSTHVADMRTNLSVVCHYLGDDTTALEHIAKALRTNRRERGNSHPSIGALLNTLGLIASAGGHAEEALKRYIEAKEIAEKHFGSNDLRFAITLDNIGCVLIELNRIDEALEHFKLAQKVVEDSRGPEHPQLINLFRHISNVYAIKGRFSKALTKARQALQMTLRYFDEKHPSVGTARLNLGIVLLSLSDFRSARKEITQAVDTLRESTGDNSSETLRAKKALSELR